MSDDDPREPPPATSVAEPEEGHGVASLPGPNEIADRIETLNKRESYGAKIALEAKLEIAKLLAVMYDTHGYKGQRYLDFAKAHGIKPTDAKNLYLVGLKADDVLLRCELDAKLKSNYEWPHWRKVMRDLRPKTKSGDDDGLSPDPADDAAEGAAEDFPEDDPVEVLQQERDEMEVQFKAANQQFRNERARREEIEERRATEQKEHDEALTVLHEVVATAQEQQTELQEKLDTTEQRHAEELEAVERLHETVFAKVESEHEAVLNTVMQKHEAINEQLAALLVLFEEREPLPEPPPPEAPRKRSAPRSKKGKA